MQLGFDNDKLPKKDFYLQNQCYFGGHPEIFRAFLKWTFRIILEINKDAVLVCVWISQSDSVCISNMSHS